MGEVIAERSSVVAVELQYYFRFYQLFSRRMQRLSNRGPSGRDLRTTKITTVTSKNKKQHKLSSNKNIKLIKSISPKGQFAQEESKLKLKSSPQPTGIKDADNDYGVNPYYPRYKVKTSQKKDQEVAESTDYGTLSHSKDNLNASQFEHKSGSKIKRQESDYVETAFQKIRLPNPRGLINAEGKFVSARPQKQSKNHSFNHKSISKHSFSLNFTSRDESRYKKKKSGKSKSKPKLIEAELSREYRTKAKSLEKIHPKDHHSYYERNRQEGKSKAQKKRLKERQRNECQKIASINSKTTSIGADPGQTYSPLALAQDPSFLDSVKYEILQDSKLPNLQPDRNRLSESALRQRSRALQMVSRICSLMSMKKQTFFLCMHYLDTFICHFSYPSMKLACLGALTLALKMDDAEMVSKFCYNYLCSPERTVKKGGSTKYLKIKQKQSMVRDDGKEVRSKLSAVIATRIAEGKGREDYSLEEILDFETHIMIKLGYKLTAKTVGYWLDLFTALWDSYLAENSSKHWEILSFRDEKRPKNLSLALQLIQAETLAMGHYGKSKVGLVLGAIYLIGRLTFEESEGRQGREQLWEKYRVSLMKSSNLVFCDSIGMNELFGDFLGLFDLSLVKLVDSVQQLSRNLSSQVVGSETRLEGYTREDRLSTYSHWESSHWELPLY